ncbi:MAG: MutS-related protein [Ginsengibacter sp.]
MEIDKTTLNDLSIFNQHEELSVFAKLNLTRTVGGSRKMQQIFSQSPAKIENIIDIQNTLKLFIEKEAAWPGYISNGSILMIYKFFESAIDTLPSRPTFTTAYYYKIFHAPDFSLVKYSTGHLFDFIKGMHAIIDLFAGSDVPQNLKKVLDNIQILINRPALQIIYSTSKSYELSLSEMLGLAWYIRYHYKQQLYELIELYGQLDAWYGMAKAVVVYNLEFPVFIKSLTPVLKAKGLYHILLKDPISYDMQLSKENNFVFLTGANMAGKSTFIKAVGSAVFLAHIGMGVPAESMEISLFDGLVSNINVMDNVVKGESYFYNEVQRIKNTILKITDGRKWLVLIDELFKGTNIEDAMKCSTVVIEGLIKIKDSLFILSTHLYEISNALEKYPNIDFKYFETTVQDEQLTFRYQLKDGVSNDRLGFLILKNEKVIELLEGL